MKKLRRRSERAPSSKIQNPDPKSKIQPYESISNQLHAAEKLNFKKNQTSANEDEPQEIKKWKNINFQNFLFMSFISDYFITIKTLESWSFGGKWLHFATGSLLTIVL